ncbi:hypothetical protein CAter282_0961 [Collimonas arenae]|uniref:Uncharacterized protein n=1 Tax=Collimonas arenae TaxID=279058 RepID=A0A127QFC9_9BURK|nr:hypothetical protein [Collimonas arenae]AMP08759.1 hypothetical protein CAter282_0961 [Collimonas arenae]
MQRSDLVPLKGQLALLQPDAVTDMEAVANDTRLPSRSAVDRQLGIDAANPHSLAACGQSPSPNGGNAKPCCARHQ